MDYKIVNGTSYNTNTPDEVINVLERCRKEQTRIILDYGDTETGESWNETFNITGRIGRSAGSIKIPILVYNKRCIGGFGVLDHCIVGIKESRGGKVLYKQVSNG